MMSAGGEFTVAPSFGLILWTMFILAVLGAGVVTALKGRWIWLLAGLATGGLVWLYAATLSADAGSTWERWARRREHPGD